MAWSSDGTRLATGSDGKTVRLWDPTTGRCTTTLEDHTDEVTGVAWSRDGAYLASMDASGLLIIWDSAGRQASSLVLQPSECLAFSAATIAVVALLPAAEAVSSGAVGLTGEPAGVGLHGIGGIGRSVLAAALASDDRVRRRFPDGVFWVTVGERPDVLALQLDLLSRLGTAPEARMRADATRALRAALAEKRVLLIVDDVWSADDAQDFRVIGPRGRLLYTSRDQDVVTAAGATAVRVGVLSPDAAQALAGEVLGVPAATLPPAADRAFAAVGHVPLAVALLAAAVRGRQDWAPLAPTNMPKDGPSAPDNGLHASWEAIAADLARDADVYGTHPYATTFRALSIAVAELPADLRAALLGLAVFPPDTAIPLAAIARYWTHTRDRRVEETAADLDRLGAAEVLQRSGDAVRFHDLAHEYLLLHADALPSLHAHLLDAYRLLLAEPDQWWTLPADEPYIWEHLAAHLAHAGDHMPLVATVTDPAYQARRITRDGPHAGEADLTVAVRVVPDHPVAGWWRAWLARYGHLLTTGAATDGSRVATTMSTWLEADPTRPEPVRPGRLVPLLTRPYLAVHGGLTAAPSALVRVLTGHRYGVFALAWSPDGSRLMTGSADQQVRLWDAATGATTVTLTDHTDWVHAVSWSPDGTRLASAGNDGTVRLWSPPGTPTATLTHDAGSAVHAMSWSPDGTRLATGHSDGTVHLWNVATGTVTLVLTGHTDRVNAVSWSPDGSRLATAGYGGLVRLHDVASGSTTTLYSGFHTMAWSPDGTRLAAAGPHVSVRVWNAATGAITAELAGHAHKIEAVAWSPDGTRLATGAPDGTVRVWDPGTGAGTAILAGHSRPVLDLAWSPDGTQLATASGDASVRLWDPVAAETTTRTDPTSTVYRLAWSPDGTHLAAGTGNTITITNHDNGRTTTLTDRAPGVNVLAWSPDGTRLAVVTEQSADLWDPVAAVAVVGLPIVPFSARAAAWSPVGGLIAIADRASLRLCNATDGAEVAELDRSGRTEFIHPVMRSPDGTVLATEDYHVVRLWRFTASRWRRRARWRVVQTLTGHTGAIRAVAWSPDGTRLASTGYDCTLRLWRPDSGTAAACIATGHRDSVHSVGWSPDGHHLATGDETGLVIVWDRNGQEVTSLVLQPSWCLAWGAPLIAVGQPGRPAILELRDPADLDP